jgi:ferrous iron transport protein A
MSLLTIILNNPLWKLLATHQNTGKSSLAETAAPKPQPERSWGFTFYGETTNAIKDSLKNLNCDNSSESFSLDRFQQESNRYTEDGLASFPLAMLLRNPGEMLRPQCCANAHRGDRLLIVQLNGSPKTQRNLMDMGLCLGKEIQVVSVTDTGSVIVAIANRQLGLGATQAQQIMVTKVILMNSQPTKIERTQVKPSDLQNQKPSPIKNICLGDLTQGAKGRVLGYQQVTRGYKGKLLAMGLTPGTEFAITRYAPLGDPVEIRVRGFSLSLRQSEANALLVEEVCE